MLIFQNSKILTFGVDISQNIQNKILNNSVLLLISEDHLLLPKTTHTMIHLSDGNLKNLKPKVLLLSDKDQLFTILLMVKPVLITEELLVKVLVHKSKLLLKWRFLNFLKQLNNWKNMRFS